MKHIVDSVCLLFLETRLLFCSRTCFVVVIIRLATVNVRIAHIP